MLAAELRRRLPDRADLGVRGGVVRLSDKVDRLCNDLAPPGDDAGEGAAAALDVGVGQLDGSLDQIHRDTPLREMIDGLGGRSESSLVFRAIL